MSDRYLVKGKIAEGGMGVVYKAFDKDLKRDVAMKVVKPELLKSHPTVRARFIEEAQVTGRLLHTGIVPVYELNLEKEDQPYYTMLLVKGEEFEAIIKKVKDGDPAWTLTRAVGVLLRVCEAMAYAHDKGVVHRDLKPSNVLVGRHGEVYAMDWGLVLVKGTEDLHEFSLDTSALTINEDPVLRADGQMIGTPAYMPPEQAAGRTREVGPRSDVYSLGAILYHLLAGSRPYARPANVARDDRPRWVSDGPPDPLLELAPEAPAELVSICEKAMAREPAKRYASMGRMADDLRAYLENRVVEAHKTGVIIEMRKWVQRNRVLAAMAALIVVGLCVVGVVDAAKNREIHRQREAALVAQSLFLSDKANELIAAGDAATALLLALEALPREVNEPDRPYVPEAEATLYDALSELREVSVLRAHARPVRHATTDGTCETLVTASDDGTARIWSTDGEARGVLEPAGGEVTRTAINADGTLVVTVTVAGSVQVWDMKGSEIARLEGHEEPVTGVAFSLDGERLATASADGTARVWDLRGDLLAVLKGHSDELTDVSFSPDGERIATASIDGQARIWTSEGESLAELEHGDRLTNVAFSPEGDCILTSSWDNTARLWSLAGEEIARIEHRHVVNRATFSPNGRLIATASSDHTARIWRRGRTEVLELVGHGDTVSQVAFSRDGENVATVSRDGTVRVWSADGLLRSVLGGHGDEIVHAAFTADSRRVVTASRDGTLRVWTAFRDETVVHRGSAAYATFQPDGEAIAAVTADGFVHLWGLDRERIASIRGAVGHSIVHAAFRPDGQRIVTSSGDHTARVWDRHGNELVLLQHEAKVVHAEFNDDGSRIVTASADGTARVWNSIGHELAILLGHTRPLIDARFSPDGSTIVTTADDGSARLWHPNGEAIVTVPHDLVRCAAFDPGSKRLLTAGLDGSAGLWDLEGNNVATLRGHQEPIHAVAFAPDGDLVATASDDGTARLWASDGSELAVLEGHQGGVTSAAFSPDGERVVTASEDHTARVWNTEGWELATLKGHGDMVMRAAFSPDGRYVLTTAADGLRLFPVPQTQELIDRAREAAPRELTEEQRGLYFRTGMR